MLHGSSLRLTTTTFSMLGVFFNASSAMLLSGMLLPPRNETFAVMSSLQSESLMRSRERIRAEPAEHDGMDRADARAGEHGDGGFGNHRHVNRHAVALFDAERFQHVGELADLRVQFRVGELLHFLLRFALPDDGGLVAARF